MYRRMLQCEITKSISSTFTAPIENGPAPRWKRKSSCQNTDVERVGLNMSENRTSTPSRRNSARTPSKTPTKYVKTPTKTPTKFSTAGDRYIPNRSAMDFDNSHYKLVHERPSSNFASPSKQEEEKRLKENFNPNASKSKIMSFKIKAPAAEANASNSKVLYSQNAATPASAKKSKSRYIPQVPERILDAPDYVNDYYLNLIDWGSGSHLAVALGNNVYIWDSKTGSIAHLCELDSENSYITSVKWEKANGYLAIGTSDCNVQLWDVEKSKRLRQMTGHASRVGSLSWNSYMLSSGSRSGAIHHHDVRVVQHQIGALSGHSQEVCGLQWSPDGKHLASGGNDNLLNIWDSTYQDANTPLHSLAQHTAGVKAVAWCPWQNSILASGGGSADRCIKFWNANTGICLNSVDSKSQVCGILWSERYKELISGHGYSQNQLSIWKYPSMTKVIDLTGHTSRILQITMSPDETFVMSAAADETLRLWKTFPNEEKKKTARTSKQDSLSIFKFR